MAPAGKYSLITLVVVALVAALAILGQGRPPTRDTESTLRVTASFYPLAFFAEEISAGRVTVTNLTPAGVEPHDFELTLRDRAAMQKSDLILVNGAGFEPWLGGILDELAASGVAVVEMSRALSPDTSLPGGVGAREWEEQE